MIDAKPDEIREAGLQFEAVKMRMSQDKDGWTLTVRVHPDDVRSGNLSELLTDHVGTRYMTVMVRLGDQDQPVMSEAQIEGKRLVKIAGMLCDNDEFQRWLYRLSRIDDMTKDAAATWMREILGIESRANLATCSEETRARFKNIVREFEGHMASLPESMERRR